MDTLISWPTLIVGAVLLMAFFFWFEKHFIPNPSKHNSTMIDKTTYNREDYKLKIKNPREQKSLRATQYLIRHSELLMLEKLTEQELAELHGLTEWLRRNLAS
jgi:hypothetical protein